MADNADSTDNFEVVTSESAAPAEEPKQAAPDTAEGEGSTEPKADDKPKGDEPKGEDESKGGKSAADDNSATDTGADRRSGRFQKRIDKLTKRAAEAERRAQELEQRLAEKEGKTDSSEEPDPADFDDYGKYLDALADWKEQGDKPQGDDAKPDQKPGDKDEPKAPEVSQEFVDALEDVQEAFADMREKHADFDELIQAPDLRISEDMVIALSETDNPGDIAYHLARNKEEAARIAELSPYAQAKEIGKLEAKLAQAPPKPAKKITNAPDPIEPVTGSDHSSKDVQDMSFAEFEQKRNQQEQSGGGFW